MKIDEAMKVLNLVRDKDSTTDEEYEACCVAYGCMVYYLNTVNLPDCNECKKKRTGCEYLPKYGEYTRINCPLFEPEENLASVGQYADQPALAPA